MAERKSFLMRIDPALWCEIERWAADELRSVNGQVEFILRDAIKRRGVTLSESDPSASGSESGDESGNASGDASKEK